MLKTNKGIKVLSGEHAVIIDNLLVYNKHGKITRVYTVNSDLDTVGNYTYATFAMEDLINYERDKEFYGYSLSKITHIEQVMFEGYYGGKINIRADFGRDYFTDSIIGMGRQREVRRQISYHFEDEQNRTGSFEESLGNSNVKIESLKKREMVIK